MLQAGFSMSASRRFTPSRARLRGLDMVVRFPRWSDRSGQVTVELAVVLPVVIVVAVIVVNAMTFFAECAEFDRVGRNAVRMCATSPSGSVELSRIAAEVESAVEESMALDADEVEVLARQVDSGHAAFELVLRFRPGLFGMGLRDVSGFNCRS